LTNRVMEEPGDYIREEFPVYYTSLKIPENANSQVSFYGKFSEKDILDFMYGKGPTEAASEGVSYITGYKILTEDLVSWTGESEPGITDSAIVMLMTYAPCEPDEYGCTHRYCDLVILRAVNDSLSVVARTGFGPYEEFRAEGGGGRQDGLELELYRIHPSASAVGLRYIYSEGTDLGSEGLEKIDLYIVGLSDKVVMPVLSLDMGRSSYEYTGGPEGGISSSSVISSEIGISGEMTNGFYRIIHTTIHREIANGEVTLEESSSAAYAWETSAYMPERERE
jgi:hypothetical protein